MPNRPDDLKITDAKKNSVALKWKPPKSDGGSEITEYLVEKRQVGKEEYTPATDEKVTDTFYVVTGFKEGDHFEFRVSAKNEVGVGQPSFPTKPVICREIQGMYFNFQSNVRIFATNTKSLFLIFLRIRDFWHSSM